MTRSYSGIYRILNKVNNKCYVGSSNNVKQRISHHKCDLRKNWHENKHLQFAWNKYKEENFEFIILLFCKRNILIEKEQQMIDFYDAYNKGYNLCPAAGSCLGYKHTEETKKKMMGNTNGKGRKGQKHSEETKQKQREAKLGKSAGMKNKKHTEETKEKMRIVKLGKPHPNNGQKGLKRSEELKLRMGNLHKGMTYKPRKNIKEII